MPALFFFVRQTTNRSGLVAGDGDRRFADEVCVRVRAGAIVPVILVVGAQGAAVLVILVVRLSRGPVLVAIHDGRAVFVAFPELKRVVARVPDPLSLVAEADRGVSIVGAHPHLIFELHADDPSAHEVVLFDRIDRDQHHVARRAIVLSLQPGALPSPRARRILEAAEGVVVALKRRAGAVVGARAALVGAVHAVVVDAVAELCRRHGRHTAALAALAAAAAH